MVAVCPEISAAVKLRCSTASPLPSNTNSVSVPIFFSQLSAAAVWSKKARVSGVLSVRVIFTTLPVAESAISSVCLLQEASMARAAVAAKIIFFIDLIDFMPLRAAVNKKWWMNVSR